LADLKQRDQPRFERIDLTFAQIAELDALAAVHGQAQSGDLDIEARPGQAHLVSGREVSAAYDRLGRYARCPVLRNLLGVAPAISPSAFTSPGEACRTADQQDQVRFQEWVSGLETTRARFLAKPGPVRVVRVT